MSNEKQAPVAQPLTDEQINDEAWRVEAVKEYEPYTGSPRLKVEGLHDFAHAIAAKLHASTAPAPVALTPAQQHADELLAASLDALSICASVNMSPDRRVMRDGCTLFSQTEEWCQWAQGEVQSNLRAVLAKIEATSQEGGAA